MKNSLTIPALMATSLQIRDTLAQGGPILPVTSTSPSLAVGRNCASLPPDSQLDCYHTQCPMPGPPGFSCASLAPPYQIECYQKRCNDVFTSATLIPATANGLVTSIVYDTTLITITSCAPEITNCPAKIASEIVITSSVVAYTTICPVAEIANAAQIAQLIATDLATPLDISASAVETTPSIVTDHANPPDFTPTPVEISPPIVTEHANAPVSPVAFPPANNLALPSVAVAAPPASVTDQDIGTATPESSQLATFTGGAMVNNAAGWGMFIGTAAFLVLF